jgi:PadR family transcriptional regulator PadR
MFFSNTVRMRPATYYVLVASSDGPAYGYGIRERVRRLTDDTVDLRPSTLYGTLERLTDWDYLSREGLESRHGPARQYYAITARGRRALDDELDRLVYALGAAVRMGLDIRRLPGHERTGRTGPG